jgi:hypothetical protein
MRGRRLHLSFTRRISDTGGLDLKQTFFPDAIPLYEDTWPAIEHLIFEPVSMNIIDYSVILCSGLQPKCRDIQLSCLLEQTERHLSLGSVEATERGNRTNLGVGDDAH